MKRRLSIMMLVMILTSQIMMFVPQKAEGALPLLPIVAGATVTALGSSLLSVGADVAVEFVLESILVNTGYKTTNETSRDKARKTLAGRLTAEMREELAQAVALKTPNKNDPKYAKVSISAGLASVLDDTVESIIDYSEEGLDVDYIDGDDELRFPNPGETVNAYPDDGPQNKLWGNAWSYGGLPAYLRITWDSALGGGTTPVKGSTDSGSASRARYTRVEIKPYNDTSKYLQFYWQLDGENFITSKTVSNSLLQTWVNKYGSGTKVSKFDVGSITRQATRNYDNNNRKTNGYDLQIPTKEALKTKTVKEVLDEINNDQTKTFANSSDYEDALPPNPPRDLEASIGDTSATFDWEPPIPKDDVTIAGYNLYINGSKENVSLIGGRTTAVFYLSPATTYQISVSAVSTIGRESERTTIFITTTGRPGEYDPTPTKQSDLDDRYDDYDRLPAETDDDDKYYPLRPDDDFELVYDPALRGNDGCGNKTIYSLFTKGLVGCGDVHWQKLKAFEDFKDEFPFSIPWDIKRGFDAAFGGMGGSKPSFPFTIYGNQFVLTFPDQWDDLFPFVRSVNLVIFDLGLCYGLYRMLGGAS